MTMNDVGKITHVLKHSHRRCVVGDFDKNLHEGYIWTVPRAVLFFIPNKSIFLHFLHNGTNFITIIWILMTEESILMMM